MLNPDSCSQIGNLNGELHADLELEGPREGERSTGAGVGAGGGETHLPKGFQRKVPQSPQTQNHTVGFIHSPYSERKPEVKCQAGVLGKSCSRLAEGPRGFDLRCLDHRVGKGLLWSFAHFVRETGPIDTRSLSRLHRAP